jgi:hypothetical protein
MERLVWKVVNIRYFDWAKGKSKEAKCSFVSAAMLKEVVVSNAQVIETLPYAYVAMVRREYLRHEEFNEHVQSS